MFEWIKTIFGIRARLSQIENLLTEKNLEIERLHKNQTDLNRKLHVAYTEMEVSRRVISQREQALTQVCL